MKVIYIYSCINFFKSFFFIVVTLVYNNTDFFKLHFLLVETNTKFNPLAFLS